ncbi:hypothetical protein [Allomuricauda sp. M10]|uniref:hypothetical protein n=1 Tax=Allomuricauda sp. M10 TaxID=2683292 RepID=UPI001D185346|nr:hypothetical protein [Muricauda sp. M10]
MAKTLEKINNRTIREFKSGSEVREWINEMEPGLNIKTMNACKIYQILEQVKYGVTSMEEAEEQIKKL